MADEAPPKRRRRGGWDTPAPVSELVPNNNQAAIANIIAQASAQARSAPSSSSASHAPPPPPQLSTPQSISDDYGLQQAAKLKAQILASQLNRSENGLTPNAPLMPSLTASRPDSRIYVGQLHFDIKEAEIKELFSVFGQITRIDMKLDPVTGRNLTYCFLEYLEVSMAHAAMKMEGFELAGRKIKVRLPVHGNMPVAPVVSNPVISNILKEHNLTSNGGTNIGITGESNTNISLGTENKCKYLIVKNIHSAITQDEIKSIFGVFGNIKLCYIISIEASSRTGFIEFELIKSCQDALIQMKNFSLAGLTLELEQTMILKESLPDLLIETSTLSITQVKKSNLQTRLEQMNNDQIGFGIEVLELRSVTLENMVTFEESLDPDLKEEISIEARKFGTLNGVSIGIDSSTKEVIVKLIYSHELEAKAAYEKMNGRYFGKKPIKATLCS